MLDPTDLFESLKEYDRSAENADSKGHVRFASVDTAYSGVGPARVMFDGETAFSTKAYQFINQAPGPGVRVLMLPVDQTYVILGMLNGGV